MAEAYIQFPPDGTGKMGRTRTVVLGEDTVHESVVSLEGDLFTKAFAYDAGGNLEYQGWALPGSAKSAAAWAIRKYTYSSGALVDVQWAGGDADFSHVWDDRASLAYE